MGYERNEREEVSGGRTMEEEKENESFKHEGTRKAKAEKENEIEKEKFKSKEGIKEDIKWNTVKNGIVSRSIATEIPNNYNRHAVLDDNDSNEEENVNYCESGVMADIGQSSNTTSVDPSKPNRMIDRLQAMFNIKRGQNQSQNEEKKVINNNIKKRIKNDRRESSMCHNETKNEHDNNIERIIESRNKHDVEEMKEEDSTLGISQLNLTSIRLSPEGQKICRELLEENESLYDEVWFVENEGKKLHKTIREMKKEMLKIKSSMKEKNESKNFESTKKCNKAEKEGSCSYINACNNSVKSEHEKLRNKIKEDKK